MHHGSNGKGMDTTGAEKNRTKLNTPLYRNPAAAFSQSSSTEVSMVTSDSTTVPIDANGLAGGKGVSVETIALSLHTEPTLTGSPHESVLQ